MDQEIITRYIQQPAHLPSDLRAQLERDWGGQPVLLYALSDLDHALTLGESWLALGPTHLALARSLGGATWDVRSIARDSIRSIQELPGLSANTLLFLGAPDDEPLAAVRYTRRQRGAIENIRFVLDEALA